MSKRTLMQAVTTFAAGIAATTSAYAHHGEEAVSAHAMEHVLEALPVLVVVGVVAFFVVRKLRA